MGRDESLDVGKSIRQRLTRWSLTYGGDPLPDKSGTTRDRIGRTATNIPRRSRCWSAKFFLQIQPNPVVQNSTEGCCTTEYDDEAVLFAGSGDRQPGLGGGNWFLVPAFRDPTSSTRTKDATRKRQYMNSYPHVLVLLDF